MKLALYVVTEWNKICSSGHTDRTSSSCTFRPRWVRDRDEHQGYGQNDQSQQMMNGFSVEIFVTQPCVYVYAKFRQANEIWARRAPVEDVSTAVAALWIKATIIGRSSLRSIEDTESLRSLLVPVDRRHFLTHFSVSQKLNGSCSACPEQNEEECPTRR